MSRHLSPVRARPDSNLPYLDYWQRFGAIAALLTPIIVACWYYVPDLFFQPPHGIHFIRQSDSLAFVEYYRLGLGDLIHPGVLDLNTAPDNGRTAGEFPILYWLAAMIPDVAGLHQPWIRVMHLGLLLLGLICFQLALSRICYSNSFAAGVIAWLMGSSVIAYYGCNYLPDPAALGFALLGWAVVLPALASNRIGMPWVTVVAFSLSGMLKAPAAINLIALFVTGLALRSLRHQNEGSLKQLVLRFALGILPIVAWHTWAIRYNAENSASYFLTSSTPMWSMSGEERAATSHLVLNYWWSDYLHPTTWHLLPLILVGIILLRRRTGSGLIIAFTASMLGTVSYIILFYQKFADHDYYFLPVVPAIALLLAALARGIGTWVENRIARYTLLSVICGMAIASLNLAHIEMLRRTVSLTESGSAAKAAASLAITDSLLPEYSRVIVLGDTTPNGVLTSIHRQGWSFPGYPHAKTPDYDELLQLGATHVLAIAPFEPPGLKLEIVSGNSRASLWAIIR